MSSRRGRLEGLLAPGVPVHGVARVLEQVGARFAGQAVRGLHRMSVLPAAEPGPTSPPGPGRPSPGSWRGC
ncbi:MAG: hypothetical protein MZV64_12725 [Ignavibacteriales bacterium]|nr:hypothetical protein [Ignavibacteriales bacterium]